MILGTGIDLFPIPRLERELSRWGRDFLSAFLSPEEERLARNSDWSVARLAASFAGKEAILKALDVGRDSGMHWTDVEILPRSMVEFPLQLTVRLDDPTAEVLLHGITRTRAWDAGVEQLTLELELGVDRTYVIATATASTRVVSTSVDDPTLAPVDTTERPFTLRSSAAALPHVASERNRPGSEAVSPPAHVSPPVTRNPHELPEPQRRFARGGHA